MVGGCSTLPHLVLSLARDEFRHFFIRVRAPSLSNCSGEHAGKPAHTIFVFGNFKKFLPRRCASSAAQNFGSSYTHTLTTGLRTCVITANGCGMGLPQDYGMDDILSETSLPYPAQT